MEETPEENEGLITQMADLAMPQEAASPPTTAEAEATGEAAKDVLKDVSDHGHSDSSDEVILFKGRATKSVPTPTETAVLEEVQLEVTTTEITMMVDAPSEAQPSIQTTTGEAFTPIIGVALESTQAGPSCAPAHAFADSDAEDNDHDSEDEMLADYIANMDADDMAELVRATGGNTRDLGGEDGAYDLGESEDEDEDLANDEATDGEEGEEEKEDEEEAEGAEQELSDSQLALLLSKQEELGLGSDELVLFDGFHQPRKSRAFRPQQAFQQTLNKSKRGFPSATAVADAFDEFDLMNWERPSLQARRTGKKQPPTFDNISDEELKAALTATWQKDRLSKKEKKMEREELRAKGLLKGADPNSPSVKYQTGMTLDEVAEELKTFLMGSDNRYGPLVSPTAVIMQSAIHTLSC